MRIPKNERLFSIELNSKNQLKTVSLIGDSQKEAALIEGSIGSFVAATFTEGVILEIVGSKGTLRLDIKAEEVKTKTNGDP